MVWPKSEDDHMEIGESGLIASDDGGFIEKETGNYITSEGVVYDKYGEKLDQNYFEDAEDDYPRADEEYEF